MEISNEEKEALVPKQTMDKVSIYVPKDKQDCRPVERLSKLAQQDDRSISYKAVEAILQYLDRAEHEN